MRGKWQTNTGVYVQVVATRSDDPYGLGSDTFYSVPSAESIGTLSGEYSGTFLAFDRFGDQVGDLKHPWVGSLSLLLDPA